MKSVILIAVMSAVTILLRFLPFLIFRKQTPKYVSYLGRVLPFAIIGMLVVYCLKDITPLKPSFGIPELLGIITVAGMQVFKRNSLVSILTGTLFYMVLVQVII
ncbi:MAG: AzlD domain-containing protein [Lachnospiraceae bacterium]|nr:AzlD domain-containing protein [Lachnospiraceae bacterium]